MMRCPYCGEYESKVVDTRSVDEGESVRRRRECLQCNKQFTTFEKIEGIPLYVIKKDGRKQLFNRNKIMEGLIRAGGKRQIAMQTFQNIVEEVEREIRSSDVQEITSKEIGHRVLEKLLQIDDVAYVRYASVFHQYRDIEAFKEALEQVVYSRGCGS